MPSVSPVVVVDGPAAVVGHARPELAAGEPTSDRKARVFGRERDDVSGIPADIRAVLTQLFAEGRRSLGDGDVATARDIVASARTIVRNKLPEGERRERLLHGCARVASLLDGTPESDAAAAYLSAMERRLEPAA